MHARYARNAVTSTRGYVCLSCRLQNTPSSNRRTRRYQHTDESTKRNEPETPSSPTGFSARIRAFLSREAIKKPKEAAVKDSNGEERQKSEAKEKASTSGVDETAAFAESQRLLQEKFAAQRRRDLAALQAKDFSKEEPHSNRRPSNKAERVSLVQKTSKFGKDTTRNPTTDQAPGTLETERGSRLNLKPRNSDPIEFYRSKLYDLEKALRLGTSRTSQRTLQAAIERWERKKALYLSKKAQSPDSILKGDEIHPQTLTRRAMKDFESGKGVAEVSLNQAPTEHSQLPESKTSEVAGPSKRVDSPIPTVTTDRSRAPHLSRRSRLRQRREERANEQREAAKVNLNQAQAQETQNSKPSGVSTEDTNTQMGGITPHREKLKGEEMAGRTHVDDPTTLLDSSTAVPERADARDGDLPVDGKPNAKTSPRSILEAKKKAKKLSTVAITEIEPSSKASKTEKSTKSTTKKRDAKKGAKEKTKQEKKEAEIGRKAKLKEKLEAEVQKKREKLENASPNIRKIGKLNVTKIPRTFAFRKVGRDTDPALLGVGTDLKSAMSGQTKSSAKTKLAKSKSLIEKIDASALRITPVEVEQPAVPKLAYGLERVLFNPGVYQLQDPRSRVYNFDPYLQKIMPVAEFDFNALKEYITSSRDESLKAIAKSHGKRYVGSTSSMTTVLAHFHFLLSQWRPINTTMLSKKFPAELKSFTELQRVPSAIFLRWKDGSYAIDADKQFASANILSMLGKSMEKLLTLDTNDFERYRKSSPGQVTEEEQFAPESYHYSTLGDFLMRSQLDAHDSRLPGTGMFDLKTRAVVSIRMDVQNYHHGVGYEIKGRHGDWESYEREYYDLIRAAFLKYSMQVRMGRMDGIFVAFHNIERIFGFQYISLPEMDAAIHGQWDTAIGDQEFTLSLDLLNKILDKATKKYPETSLRVHFETRDAATPFMYIFAEPVTEEQVVEIQSHNDAKIEAFEREISGLKRDEATQGRSQEDDPRWADIQANVEDAMYKDELGLEDNLATLAETEDGGDGEDADGLEVFEHDPLYANKNEVEADDYANAGVAGGAEDEDEEDEGQDEEDEDEDEVDDGEEENEEEEEEEGGDDEDEHEEDEEDTADGEEKDEEKHEIVDGEDSHDTNLEEVTIERESEAELQQDQIDQDGFPASSIEASEQGTTADIEAGNGTSDTISSEAGETTMKDTATSSGASSGSDEGLIEDTNISSGTSSGSDEGLMEDTATSSGASFGSNEGLVGDNAPSSKDEPSTTEDPATLSSNSELDSDHPEADSAYLDAQPPPSDAEPNILAMTLTLRNKINNSYVLRPEKITAEDKWSIEYSLSDIPDARRAQALYEACQTRRKKKMESNEVKGKEEGLSWYLRNLRELSRKGVEWRKGVDEKERANRVWVLGREEKEKGEPEEKDGKDEFPGEESSH